MTPLQTFSRTVVALFLIGSFSVHAAELTEDQKTLYALGQSIGQNVKVFNLTAAELVHVQAGLADSVNGKKPVVELDAYGPKLNAMVQARQAGVAAKQAEQAKPFLDKMTKEPGAEKLASGLIYIPQKAGTGDNPSATDTVKVHYRGTLIDGKEFDSSYKRGQPAEFPLNGVIKCWTEGVQKMKPGGKAKLICPASIAYGDRGNASIPGGATLSFEIELLSVSKK